MKNKGTQSNFLKTLSNIAIGGTSGTLASFVVYPIDSLKTLIQMRSEAGLDSSVIGVLRERMRTEGLLSLYRGLMTNVYRQLTFASLRLGIYFSYSDYLKKIKNKPVLSLPESAAGSMAAGAIATMAVMPIDIVYVRFQVENSLPPEQRRNYKSFSNAFSRIVQEEGIKTLWRGIFPAVCRGMSLNVGMLVPYEACKNLLAKYMGWTRKNYMLSSIVAGASAAVCCLPFDNAKVKMQKMKPGPDGKMPYKGLFDCFAKTIRKEGVLRLWAGLLPIYMVIAPHAMLTLIINDGLRILFGLTKT
jgi:solute carrier family 25 oxoglutarate transporter 11